MGYTYDVGHMDYLIQVAVQDIETLKKKEATYKGSWKKRGGVGAFMMLARKMDRIEAMMESHGRQYDIFDKIDENMSGDDGTLLAEIRDLRCYLLLVEAEMHNLATKNVPTNPPVPAPQQEQNYPYTTGTVYTRDEWEDKLAAHRDHEEKELDRPETPIPEFLKAGPRDLDELKDELKVPRTVSPAVKESAVERAKRIAQELSDAAMDTLRPKAKTNGGVPPPLPWKTVERLQDGEVEAPFHYPTITVVQKTPPTETTAGSVETFWNVDRSAMTEDHWDHLPKLRRELNFKEHEELAPHYQPMYYWDANASKFLLAQPYHEHWAK